MDYDFSIVEKIKEVYNAVRKLAWGFVSLIGLVGFVIWYVIDWATARAVSVIEYISNAFPKIDLNLRSVGLEWERINQFVPVNEAVMMGKLYLSLLCTVLIFRFAKSLFKLA